MRRSESRLGPQTDARVDRSSEQDGPHRVYADVARRLGQEIRPNAVGSRGSLANHQAPLGMEHSHARLRTRSKQKVQYQHTPDGLDQDLDHLDPNPPL